jgi:hypothetical protein
MDHRASARAEEYSIFCNEPIMPNEPSNVHWAAICPWATRQAKPKMAAQRDTEKWLFLRIGFIGSASKYRANDACIQRQIIPKIKQNLNVSYENFLTLH